jgi:hypothetical protein
MAKQTFTTGQILTAAQMTSLQQTAMGGGSVTDKTASYTLVAADAGTVVQMNSASSTTITVNTAIFAAGDTVQIQNVGAGVCTITAGTATVSTAGSLALSQYEGGQLYFNTTSASIFFDVVQASSGMTNPLTTTGDTIYSSSGTTPARLGIGSTNQALGITAGIPAWQASSKSTLTTTGDTMYASAANTPARLGIGTTGQILTVASGVPAWATASSGAMSVVKARTTFTNVATTTTTFDGVFTSSYRNYLIVFDNCSASTSSDDFLMQFRYAGPTTQATGYYGINIHATTGNAAVANAGGNATTTMQLSDDAGSSGNSGGGFAWVIDAGNDTTKTKIYGQYFETVTAGGGSFAAGNENARIYTGFILSSSSSNITGSVTVYGMVTA